MALADSADIAGKREREREKKYRKEGDYSVWTTKEARAHNLYEIYNREKKFSIPGLNIEKRIANKVYTNSNTETSPTLNDAVSSFVYFSLGSLGLCELPDLT